MVPIYHPASPLAEIARSKSRAVYDQSFDPTFEPPEECAGIRGRTLFVRRNGKYQCMVT